MTAQPQPQPVRPPNLDDAFTVRFLAGVGLWMQDRGLGYWLADGTLPPVTDDVPVIRAAGSRDDHDLAYTLTSYTVTDSPSDLDDSTLGLQLRCRGTEDVRVPLAMADALFDVLHAAHDFVLHPVPGDPSRDIYVVQANRRSGIDLGQDGNHRWERSENYYFDVSRPTPNRLD